MKFDEMDTTANGFLQPHSFAGPVVLFTKLTPEAQIPEQATPGASGFDLVAISEATMLPGARALIRTGLSISMPRGLEGQIRPRSGLALKKGVTVLNAPGTIDSDYRGEVGVILVNLGQVPVTILPGDRIAQIVFARVSTPVTTLSPELDKTERGSGGFGSTGL